jgi:hypothetical protein
MQRNANEEPDMITSKEAEKLRVSELREILLREAQRLECSARGLRQAAHDLDSKRKSDELKLKFLASKRDEIATRISEFTRMYEDSKRERSGDKSGILEALVHYNKDYEDVSRAHLELDRELHK